MMRNLCAYALSEPDPLSRFIDLTHQRHVFEGVVAGLQRERGNALADLADLGMPLDQIVERSGLTASQVRSIVRAAGRKLPASRKAGGGRDRATSKTRTGAPGQAADLGANGQAGAGRAATTGNTGEGRRRDNELPLAPVASRGSRMLTADERKALGLPPLRPLTRVPEQRVAG